MKKRRIIAMALAMTMLSSSVSFNTYADTVNADMAVEEIASGAAISSSSDSESSSLSSEADTAVISDEDAAVEAKAAANLRDPENYFGGLHTNLDNKGEWKAAVFGDAGGKEKVGGTAWCASAKDDEGYQLPYYEAWQNEDSVNLRMGAFKADGTVDEATGKISSTTDGVVYYYQELDKDTDFVLKATATVNQLDAGNNQVSFGAMARDKVFEMADKETFQKYFTLSEEAADITSQATAITLQLRKDKTLTDEQKAELTAKKDELTAQAAAKREEADALFAYDNTLNSNYVVAGPLFMNNFKTPNWKDVKNMDGEAVADGINDVNNAMLRAFYRLDGALFAADNGKMSSYDGRLVSRGDAKPAVGQSYDIVLKKMGDVYSLQFNGETPVVVDNVPIANENGKIYAGLFASRSANITYSDISLEKVEKQVESLEITKAPDQTFYIVNTEETVSTDGMIVTAKYADGSSEVIPASEYICNGDVSTVGKKQATVYYGGKSATFDIDVDYNRVVDMKLVYAPFNDTYLVGSKFSTVGMQVDATLKSGETSTLSASQYDITIGSMPYDGKTDYYFTPDMVGKQTVTVAYKGTDAVLADGWKVTFDIDVKAANIDRLEVVSVPVKGTAREPFDVNEEFNPAGLVVRAFYATADGEEAQLLEASDYTITGFDSSKEGECTVTVTLKNDPTKTCKFTVHTVAKMPMGIELLTYPRQTYFVGENFDTTGLTVGVRYDNGVTLPIEETEYKYTIDTSKFNSSTAGQACSVDIIADINGSSSVVRVEIMIVENENKIWKAAVIGQSSMGAAEGDPSSSISIYNTGSSEPVFVTGDAGYVLNEAPVGKMVDGSMTNVDKVNIRSWGGAGKFATDHDGIAYYYTRVNADNNYIVSADVTVNGYIRDPQNAKDAEVIAKKKVEMQAVYDKFGIKEEITDEMALDMVRSGQEAFGIMARDVVPLYLPSANGGDDNSITTSLTDAVKDDNGEPMNIFDAYKLQESKKLLGKLQGLGYIDANVTQETFDKVQNSTNASELTDAEKQLKKYVLTKEDINSISFASNVMVAGGCTSSTFPTDPSTSSFTTKAVQNRICLAYRSGVSDTSGAGSKTKDGFKTTTNSLPKPGDKYNITLKRINFGYSVTTYDYQTGETQTVYSFDIRDNLNGLLTRQDMENVYVGFFACRYADIDVENIKLYETDADTDKVVTDMEEKIYSPKVSVTSKLFTDKTHYNLILKASNPNGGYVTIKQGDKVIYSDQLVNSKGSRFDTVLPEGSKTEFTIIYTPSNQDLCYSYDKVVSRVIVTQKALDKENDIYVAPDGKVNNAGTKDSPIDLETAIGLVESGQKIIMLDGVYTTTDVINIEKTQSGYDGGKKYLIAEEGANPIIDLQKKNSGFLVSADYWVFKGFTVRNSGGNSKPFHLGSQHVLVENCTFYGNGDSGFQISRTDSSPDMADWPSDILVLNCEAYNNCDPSKNNADGFACKLTVGNNVVFKGCVSHHNLDDGWDLYTKLSSGVIGSVKIEDCVSYRQGYELLANGTDTDWNATSGGNGFKMGGESLPVNHYLKDCKSFMNKGNGLDTNTNPTLKLRNIVSYNNEVSNLALYSPARSLYNYDLKGVVSYTDTLTKNSKFDRIGSLTEQQGFRNNSATPLVSDSNYIIYDINAGSVNGNNQLATADLFKSVDKSDSLNSEMRYTRGADGAFVWGDFLERATAYAHDAGDDIVLPNVGRDSLDEPTYAPTEGTTTEPTTSNTINRPSNGGGGGGGGSSSPITSTQTTEEVTKDDVTNTEVTTEITTEDVTSNNLFTDIDSKPWAVEAINTLAELGIINGVGDGKFAPDANCKRADFVIMLTNIIGIEGTATDNFDDVDPAKYYYNAVGLAKEEGIVNGYGDGNFGPENSCTRAELMVMVANAIAAMGNDISADTSVLDKFADADAIPAWAVPYVAFLVENEVVNGANGMINPNANITRAEVAVIMFNLIEIDDEAEVEEITIVDEETEETSEEVEDVTEATEEVTEETTEAVVED